MNYETEKNISCCEFEENLTNYLEKTMDSNSQKACASHVLKCPLCHSLLNEVKKSLEVCREIATPKVPMTKLEAGILARTMPEVAMNCEEFELYLTDYLDGFLPATLFHRWERHACVCKQCEDLPGEVVRSLGTLVAYKTEELELPQGLHARILQNTIGTENAKEIKPSLVSQVGEWIRSWQFPVSIPQLAPVAMMLIFAFMILTQTVSADGSISGMYQKSFELAQQTYQQTTQVLGESKTEQKNNQKPVDGILVDYEGNK